MIYLKGKIDSIDLRKWKRDLSNKIYRKGRKEEGRSLFV
jgi:hypothetical protein